MLNVGLFNARSVGNKADSVSSWIFDGRLSLAAVVETWHDGYNTSSLVACCPDGYNYVEQASARQHAADMTTNHGGVCLFYNRQLRVQLLCLPVYNTFECVCASIRGSGFQLTTAVLYRPGSQAVSDNFFSER